MFPSGKHHIRSTGQPLSSSPHHRRHDSLSYLPPVEPRDLARLAA
jgi:hypothetical protein